MADGHRHRFEVHVHDPVPRIFLDGVGRRVAAAGADIVDQDVDPVHPRRRFPSNGRAVGAACHVSGEGERLTGSGTAFVHDHAYGFLCAVEPQVHAHHLRAFAREQDRHGAAIADRVAHTFGSMGLASAHDDGCLAREPPLHQSALRSGSMVWPSSTWIPKELRIIETCVYWPTVKTRSMHWRSL